MQMGPGGGPAGGTSLPRAKKVVGDFCRETRANPGYDTAPQ